MFIIVYIFLEINDKNKIIYNSNLQVEFVCTHIWFSNEK